MMKKTFTVLVSVLVLLVGACSQIPGFTPTPGTGPTVDPASLFQTAVAQTLTARAALPSGSVTETATAPAASPVVSNTDTATLPVTDTPTGVVQTGTPAAGLTATSNIATATGLPSNVTPSPTLVPGQVTPIWTLAIRTYGTLPPAVPFSIVTLVNKADTEAYISLQVTMPNGEYSILEYPVEGRVKIQAPVGSYLYVAWVGGRKMVGEFRLRNNDEVTISLYRNRIAIQ
jgi:hypothetical protein